MPEQDRDDSGYQLFMLGLSIYVIGAQEGAGEPGQGLLVRVSGIGGAGDAV